MIFFILTTIVVQLVKFNMATLPFIQAYRRIKFKTITSDDQVVRDKNRNVFLIDSFTGPDFLSFKIVRSGEVHGNICILERLEGQRNRKCLYLQKIHVRLAGP